MSRSLATAYDETCEETLAKWARCHDIGSHKESAFHPTKLSITSGNYLPASQAVADLLSQLDHLAGRDPRADIIVPACLHATFLALSLPRYDSVSELPPLTEVKALFGKHCERAYFSLRDLRLVALPNALLLAGDPDTSTLARRQAFAESLLASPWRSLLQARYPEGIIPPLFWHSTLLRYRAEYLPDPLRRFFVSQREARYGNASLPVRLMATNYDWKISFQLETPPSCRQGSP